MVTAVTARHVFEVIECRFVGERSYVSAHRAGGRCVRIERQPEDRIMAQLIVIADVLIARRTAMNTPCNERSQVSRYRHSHHVNLIVHHESIGPPSCSSRWSGPPRAAKPHQHPNLVHRYQDFSQFSGCQAFKFELLQMTVYFHWPGCLDQLT